MSESPEASPTAHVVIVGGGAAGTSCALFLARAGITSTIFDHDRTILKRAELHNFPGISPIGGVAWLAQLRATLAETGMSSQIGERATSLFVEGDTVGAASANHRVSGDYVVIATGQLNADFTQSVGMELTDPVQPFVTTNVVVDHWGATNVDRMFAAGVVAGFPSQAVICAGSGANVAIGIASKVHGAFWVDHDEAPKPAGAAEEE
jgi:thioredoxin reductase